MRATPPLWPCWRRALPEGNAITPAILLITRAVEAVGIGVIIVGLVAALAIYGRKLVLGTDRDAAFHALRSNLGRAILLGLELLVAADIINTVAVEPTVQSVLVLAGIVMIRTFLSFSLEIEIEGKLPWRRAETTGEDDRAKQVGS